MVMHLYDETPLIKRHPPLGKVFEHIVGDRTSPEVLEKYAHRRLVLEHALLLIETEVRRVQVDYERRRVPGELLENIFIGHH